MKTKQLTFLLALTFLFLFSGSSVVFGDDFDDGAAAYNKQDYKNAFEQFILSALQGNPTAAAMVGSMYVNEEGVPPSPHNYAAAVYWYRLSAEQGFPGGQQDLGVMYNLGRGVPQDFALAHMWFNVCASTGNEKCMKQRNIMEKKMTPSQIEKAQDMARNWKPKTDDQLRKLMGDLLK